MKYIIMAGGTYPKFKIPKQLLKINGEVIIERTIRQLRENGITDIAVSTNNPAFDYLDVEILHDADNQFLYWGKDENKKSNNCWLKAYYPVEEPVCYLHGDVYFSDDAIKTIVNTKVKDTMFFCTADKKDIPYKDIRCAGGREPLAYKVENYKLFRSAVNDLLRMVDEGRFKNAFCGPIAWNMYRYLNGLDLGFNAKWYGEYNSIFNSKGDYVIINDYTNDVDDEKDIAKIENLLKIGGDIVVRCEVIEKFTLGEFDKLKNLKRKSLDTKGTLYVGDTFECDDKMAKYLTGGNALKKVVIKVLEIVPNEVKEIKDVDDALEKIKESAKEEVKIAKKNKKSKR